MTLLKSGYKVRKTAIDKENIEPRLLEGYVKNVDGQLVSTDENGNEVEIDLGNIQVTSSLWKRYTINPAVNDVAIYTFVNPENIYKTGGVWSIRVLLNGIELDSDEISVAANNHTVTLTLQNNLTIDSTDELKVWYIKA